MYFLTSTLKFMQAEQKAREESERLRQQEREQIVEKRKRDLVCFHISTLIFIVNCIFVVS